MHPKWNKKVTLDLDQLKATLQKIILQPKKKDIHRQHLFSVRPPFCFLLGMAYIFFLMIVYLLGRKNH